MIWTADLGADEWNVTLDRLHVGRYLVLARDAESAEEPFFHLRKVRVFGLE